MPLLSSGDYHLIATREQIEDLFDIPETGDIDPARYAELKLHLERDGFTRQPVVATLYSDGAARWLGDPERVRAGCGATGSCIRRICEAVTCAAGASSACDIEQGAPQRSGDQQPPPPPSTGGNPSPS